MVHIRLGLGLGLLPKSEQRLKIYALRHLLSQLDAVEYQVNGLSLPPKVPGSDPLLSTSPGLGLGYAHIYMQVKQNKTKN